MPRPILTSARSPDRPTRRTRRVRSPVLAAATGISSISSPRREPTWARAGSWTS